MKYKYKAKDYRKKVKKYWKMLEHIETQFIAQVSILEQQMAKEIGIKDIEFFFVDGEIVGIGSESKSLELIYR